MPKTENTVYFIICGPSNLFPITQDTRAAISEKNDFNIPRENSLPKEKQISNGNTILLRESLFIPSKKASQYACFNNGSFFTFFKQDNRETLWCLIEIFKWKEKRNKKNNKIVNKQNVS